MHKDTKTLAQSGMMDGLLMAVGTRHRLTPREVQALIFVIDDAYGNGFDFAITSDVFKPLSKAQGKQVAMASLSGLHQKSAITIHEAVTMDHGDGFESEVQQITLDAAMLPIVRKAYELARKAPK
jgi:hypothetical protein